MVKTPLGNVLFLSMMDGPKLEVIGTQPAEYQVRFTDESTGIIVYETTIRQGCWCAPNLKYFVRWYINVSENGAPVFEHRFDCTGKRVWFGFDSNALGDTIAWMPYIEEFRKHHQCEVHAGTYWNHLFKEAYPEIKFETPGADERAEYYAGYKIGAWDDNYNRNKNNWRLIPLQQTASDLCGLDYREVRPRIVRSNLPRLLPEKYVAVGEGSTMQGKHWNYAGGWQTLVNRLKAAGYRVMSVAKEKTKLDHIIAMNDRPIEETIRNIQHAEFFIGLGSGLSWLAWGLDVPVVLIAGFSLPYSEMRECIRVHNPNVCTGCYNDITLKFDRGNWRWCPRNKNYECTTKITPDMVWDAMQPLLEGKRPAPLVNLTLPETPVLRYGDVTLHTRTGVGRAGDIDIANEHFVRDIYCLKRLSKFITPKTMADVGGHIGSAAALAKTVWPSLRITAIEPNPESAKLYRWNVPDATLHEFAVGEAGHAILVDNPRWSGGGLVKKPGESYPDNYTVTREIRCRPFHELVEGPIDLLKLDCEGGEMHLMRTIPDELLRTVGCIVGEYHCDWYEWRDLVLSRLPEWDIIRLMEKNFVAGPQQLMTEMRRLCIADSKDTPLGNTIRLTLEDNPIIHIDGLVQADYEIVFDDPATGRHLYTTTVKPEHWAKVGIRADAPCNIRVSENGTVVYQKMLNMPKPVVPSANGHRKVLFIAPHCSTGGMPQYLLKCVLDLKAAGTDVRVVEYTCIATDYIVQRKKLQAAATFHSLNGNKVESLRRIIDDFQPDVVHLQEFPEAWHYDASAKAAMDMIYRGDRKYRIVETSHDSTVDPSKKTYRPDAFAFVSKYHADRFAGLGIPTRVVEYKLDKRVRPDRASALRKLGLDSNQRHVLNVGLFTPQKNQSEVFALAKRLPGVQFHFVGNTADNYKSYWGPLIENKPSNCTVWGEQGNVDEFYAAMDLFLFTSVLELNPIVVKEALAWSMPVLMRDLPTYCKAYSDEPQVTFIDGNMDRTFILLRERLLGMGDTLAGVYVG